MSSLKINKTFYLYTIWALVVLLDSYYLKALSFWLNSPQRENDLNYDLLEQQHSYQFFSLGDQASQIKLLMIQSLMSRNPKLKSVRLEIQQ